MAGLPEVERIVYTPNPGEEQMAEAYIANEADSGPGLLAATIKKVVQDNPKIITYADQELRIPMNTTYWEGWPTADNSYASGAFWHLTFQLILNNLKAPQ